MWPVFTAPNSASPRKAMRARLRRLLLRYGGLLRTRRALLWRLRGGLLFWGLLGHVFLNDAFVLLGEIRLELLLVGLVEDLHVFFIRCDRRGTRGRRRARVGRRHVAAPLPERFIKEHGAGGRRVQRRDRAFHRDAHHLVAALEHEPADALGLAADDDRGRPAVIDLVVEEVSGLIGADDPDALLL